MRIEILLIYNFIPHLPTTAVVCRSGCTIFDYFDVIFFNKCISICSGFSNKGNIISSGNIVCYNRVGFCACCRGTPFKNPLPA